MAPETPEPDAFCASREHFEAVIGYLRGPDALRLEHAELDARLAADMREVIRQLYQDHLDLRAKNEERRDDLVAAGGVPHGAVEADHERPLSTIFASVTVRRLAYRHRGEENLYPADAALNLPGTYSGVSSGSSWIA